jgi:osmotically-inducible protein OsmY
MSHEQLTFGLLGWCLFTGAQLLGCSSRQVLTPAQGRTLSAALKRPTSSKLPSFADADIATVVKSQLTDDPGVEARDIHASATQGIVELTGTAPNLLTKRRAVRVAEAVKGVRAVSDRLELRLEPRPDKEIADDLASALRFDPAARAYPVSVKVKEGRVVLEGNLESYGAELHVTRLAESVSGVRAVDDRTIVQIPVHREDSAIATDVKRRLHWDALVNDELVTVQVRSSRVILSGHVASAAERRRVSSDAWVSGARDVSDTALKVDAWRPDLLRHTEFDATDSQIAHAIRDAAAYDPRVSAADLHVGVTAGFARLSGTVRSLAAREAVQQLAEHTVGVLAVANELSVEPFNVITDDALAKRIQRALRWSPYTATRSIVASARRGKVTLRGDVDTAFERAEASRVVSSIEGAIDIDNELSVEQPQTAYVYHPFYAPYDAYWGTGIYAPKEAWAPDDRIAQAIRHHLEWNPFVDSSEVTVEVKRGSAILSGHVGSRSQRIMASETAYESGAIDVDNRLAIERR